MDYREKWHTELEIGDLIEKNWESYYAPINNEVTFREINSHYSKIISEAAVVNG